jgi:hypothetical protein
MEKPKLLYTIVSAMTWQELERRVNNNLADGWQLQGGVAVRTAPGDFEYFFQAMVWEV